MENKTLTTEEECLVRVSIRSKIDDLKNFHQKYDTDIFEEKIEKLEKIYKLFMDSKEVVLHNWEWL